ncbi:Putative transferase [Echinococcus granulosus]|uniref:Transferase n=1 Tax=Echinococcus granulosus TaxID=6210 RepID=W6UGZ5_ECHGR|nr:Putative transferase [Echinococcus granulosus]EUB60278.1 Putative transferase [Echinococcus granulosus]
MLLVMLWKILDSGLMTNDARLIEPKNSLIYSLFLNVKGRVIGDTLIYHVNHQDQEEPHFVIECDSKCKPSVLKLLRYYDIRKKASLLRRVHISEEPSLRVLVSLKVNGVAPSVGDALFVGKDPRAVPGWCLRMLRHTAATSETACAPSEAVYRRTRYCLGLPEGADEFKSGEGLPLEANADLCHGVSFSKGCYLGQELTARSRFVGVIRRRVAPILFESPVNPNTIPLDAPIFRISKEDNKVVGNRPVGWIRGQEDPSSISDFPIRQYGLALLRLAECAAAVASDDKLIVDVSGAAQVLGAAPAGVAMVCVVQPFAPSWWPEDIAVGLPRIQQPPAPLSQLYRQLFRQVVCIHLFNGPIHATLNHVVHIQKLMAHTPELPEPVSSSEKKSEAESEKSISLVQRFKNAYKIYGKVLIVVHGVTSAAWLGLFYLIAYSGLDVVSALRGVRPLEWLVEPMVTRGLGFWATALLLYKLATPFRYFVTLAASRYVVHGLRTRGLAPPLAEEDRLRNLARQGVRLSRSRLRQSSDRASPDLVGMNVQELLESLHAPELMLKPFHVAGGSVGVFASAYVLYKVLGPLRYGLTLWLTPVIVHRLRSGGRLPPLAEQDRLRNLALEGAKRTRERLSQRRKKRPQMVPTCDASTRPPKPRRRAFVE